MHGAEAWPEHMTIMLTHLYLLVAARELPLFEDHNVVADPLEQNSHQLIVLLPAQLQVLQPAQQQDTNKQEHFYFLARPFSFTHTPSWLIQLGSNNPWLVSKDGDGWRGGQLWETEQHVCQASSD